MKRSGTVWSAFRLGKLNASGDEPLVAEVGSAIPHAHGDSNHTERCLSLYLSTIYTALAAFALVLLICMPLLRRSEGWNPTWVARTPRPTLPRSGSTPHRPRTLRGGMHMSVRPPAAFAELRPCTETLHSYLPTKVLRAPPQHRFVTSLVASCSAWLMYSSVFLSCARRRRRQRLHHSQRH